MCIRDRLRTFVDSREVSGFCDRPNEKETRLPDHSDGKPCRAICLARGQKPVSYTHLRGSGALYAAYLLTYAGFMYSPPCGGLWGSWPSLQPLKNFGGWVRVRKIFLLIGSGITPQWSAAPEDCFLCYGYTNTLFCDASASQRPLRLRGRLRRVSMGNILRCR